MGDEVDPRAISVSIEALQELIRNHLADDKAFFATAEGFARTLEARGPPDAFLARELRETIDAARWRRQQSVPAPYELQRRVEEALREGKPFPGRYDDLDPPSQPANAKIYAKHLIGECGNTPEDCQYCAETQRIK